MAEKTSYATDIRPLFKDRDVHAMRKAFNLAKYDDVKAHAAAIYDRIRGIGGGNASSAARRRPAAAIAHRAVRKVDGRRLPAVKFSMQNV
jgi:hypothetical protein